MTSLNTTTAEEDNNGNTTGDLLKLALVENNVLPTCIVRDVLFYSSI